MAPPLCTFKMRRRVRQPRENERKGEMRRERGEQREKRREREIVYVVGQGVEEKTRKNL